MDAVGGEKWRLREGYVSEGQEFLSLSVAAQWLPDQIVLVIMVRPERVLGEC